MEIPQVFLTPLEKTPTSLSTDPWNFHMFFLQYPWKFHVLNPHLDFSGIAQWTIPEKTNKQGRARHGIFRGIKE